MRLTDTFVKNVKPCKPKGDKYSDGDGVYLLVTPSGKYWRFDYRYLDKRKTLALGVYPDTTLAKARAKRASARVLLADGIDPSLEKKQEKLRRSEEAAQTFETVARRWLVKSAAERAESTQEKVKNWLQKDAFPRLGSLPITSIKSRDVLLTVQKMEARGAVESAHLWLLGSSMCCGSAKTLSTAFYATWRIARSGVGGSRFAIGAMEHPRQQNEHEA